MAGRLLCVALAAALEQGCLLPQDYQVLPELPPFRNTSPTLLIDTAEPDQRGATIRLGNGCTDFFFKIAVADPDKGDTIRSKWFVDHDKEFSTAATEGEVVDPKTLIVRPVQGQFYAMNSRLALPFNGLNVHYVTVVIADREFKPPPGIELRLNDFPSPDGGAPIKESSKTVQYTWEVNTDPTTPCQ